MKKLDKAAEVALAKIELCEQRIHALAFAVWGLELRPGEAREEHNALYAILYRRLNEAYRDLFMWGVVIGDDVRKEARRMAYKRFLEEGKTIMGYLDMTNTYSGHWNKKEVEEFRAEIKEKCTEQEGEEIDAK